MVYEGLEWGFFDNDLDTEGLNAQHKVVKADVSLAWKQTI